MILIYFPLKVGSNVGFFFAVLLHKTVHEAGERWRKIKCEATLHWVFVCWRSLSFYFAEAIAKRLCRLSELCPFGLAECSIGALSGCG